MIFFIEQKNINWSIKITEFLCQELFICKIQLVRKLKYFQIKIIQIQIIFESWTELQLIKYKNYTFFLKFIKIINFNTYLTHIN